MTQAYTLQQGDTIKTVTSNDVEGENRYTDADGETYERQASGIWWDKYGSSWTEREEK